MLQVPFNPGTSELLFRRRFVNFHPTPCFSSFRQLQSRILFALWTWTPPGRRNGDDSIASLRHAIYAKHARSNATAHCLARTASAKTTVILARFQDLRIVRPGRPRIHQLVEAAGMLLEKQHLRRRTRHNTRILLQP